jgi:predicted TIM-barrel fold metal-dependent hydrolase
MDIIDSHVHLYPAPDPEKEANVSQEPVNELLTRLSQKVNDHKIDKAVVYIIDRDFLYTKPAPSIPENLIIASIVDIDKTYTDDIQEAFEKNIRIIKILPYEQTITKDKYPNVLEIARLANQYGMILSICCTYGSKFIYDTNGVELTAFIKKEADIPIILAHGGGPRIFDAMSLALEYDDVFLELSFSLKFWWGSSVIKDYAFAIKKLESQKVFYGSDYPYVEFDESLEYLQKFVREYDFSSDEIDKILYSNFEGFRSRYL